MLDDSLWKYYIFPSSLGNIKDQIPEDIYLLATVAPC